MSTQVEIAARVDYIFVIFFRCIMFIFLGCIVALVVGCFVILVRFVKRLFGYTSGCNKEDRDIVSKLEAFPIVDWGEHGSSNRHRTMSVVKFVNKMGGGDKWSWCVDCAQWGPPNRNSPYVDARDWVKKEWIVIHRHAHDSFTIVLFTDTHPDGRHIVSQFL